jgi:DNA-binding transcriptional MerR regulator
MVHSIVTIDELARQAGTTTRNVRAMQTKGVLPPPILVGRIGDYSEDHLQRLRAVLRLQASGFGLTAIRELLAAWAGGATLADVLGLPAPARRRLPQPADSVEELVASVGPLARTAPFGLVPGPVLAELSACN